MIPQISIEVITEIAQKLATLSEQSYKTQNIALFEKEIKDLQQKQPYLLSWVALYCQACAQYGMLAQDIVAMVVFIAILKSLYAQDEVNELDKLFGDNKK